VIHGVKDDRFYAHSGGLNTYEFNFDFRKYYRFFTTKSALFRSTK